MPHKLRQVLQHQTLREFGFGIFLALPFFYAFTECDTVFSFYDNGKCKAYDFWLKVKGKMILLMFSSSLGKSLPMEHLITLTCLRILCCS